MGRLKAWLPFLPEIDVSGLLDIAIVTMMIYAFLIALKRTRRSGFIVAGIVILGAVYLLARRLNLVLTVALLQGFFTVILVALVVIFQEDLRYFFERVGVWWLERRLPLQNRKTRRLPRREAEILARTLGDLARARIGALIVVRGRDSIARHLTGGEEVKGLLSEPLLKSIFDPHSIGHDGAVVIDGQLIDRMGCYLPLSKNLEKLSRSGTRHAAALGLSELSDALCLVVSEERGTISLARQGDLRTVATPAELLDALEAFYDEIAPPPEERSWTGFFRKNYREKIAALGLAMALWMMVGYSAEVVQRTFEVQVQYSPPSPDVIVEKIQPPKVQVTFSGERKILAFLRPEDIKLILPLRDMTKGKQRFPVMVQDLSYPPGLQVQDIQPRHVVMDIKNVPRGGVEKG